MLSFRICGLTLISGLMLIVVAGSEPVTESSISSNNILASSINNRFSANLQNRFGVNKPSKLRLYLLADLAKAAAEVKSFTNCDSVADLKITTRNCSCTNYSCQRYYKASKRPRIFERNCEEVCCGKQRSKGKSLASNDLQQKIFARSVEAAKCGEIIPDKDDKLMVPWIAQILSGTQDPEKIAKNCFGSVLSSRAVITSSNCVDQSNNATVVITDRFGGKTDNIKVKHVVRDDFVKNSVMLVLSEPFNITERKYNPCLPKDKFSGDYINCHLGLSNRTATPVNILSKEQCQTVQPKVENALCVHYNFPSNENAGPGAPLLCSWDLNHPKNFQIVGVLSEKYNDILVFDNINRIHNMIKLNLKKFL